MKVVESGSGGEIGGARFGPNTNPLCLRVITTRKSDTIEDGQVFSS